MSARRICVKGAWGAAIVLLWVGCTDLRSSQDDKPDGGDASTSQSHGGSGGNRGEKDGGPSGRGDRGGGDDAGPDGGPTTPTDSADDPAAVAGGGLQLQCDADASACVAGGIVSGGADVTRAGSATLPDGTRVTLSDDGFELGATTCDVSGKLCVTGGIAP